MIWCCEQCWQAVPDAATFTIRDAIARRYLSPRHFLRSSGDRLIHCPGCVDDFCGPLRPWNDGDDYVAWAENGGVLPAHLRPTD